MPFDGVADVFTIAAAHGRHDRNLSLATGANHKFIARTQAFVREFELAQTVAFVRINARLIENKIGLKLPQNRRYVLRQQLQVRFVIHAIG